MSDKFLRPPGGDLSGLTDGTAELFVGSISVSNLDSSRALKTNATKGLESSNLNISDVTNLSTELQIKDNLTFNENDTQTNPIAGQIKLYAKTDGTLYTRDDLGNETAVGGGGVSLQAGYNNNPQIQTTAAIGPLELKESEGVASNTQLEIKNNVDAVVASINGLGAITGSSVNTDNINAQTGTVNITNNVNLQSNQIQGIASETFINNDTHANPAVNNSKLYFKTDDNLYRRNAAGGEFRLSNISLQDAFNNGSQITTDTNSLNLQSTAINPSFPLLTTIDNALNVTAEIRANGDIFCSSLLTPGQILQTGTTDTFNMTSVNTTQRDAIAGPTLGALVFNNQTETVDLYKSTGGTSNVTFDVLVVGGGGAGGVAVGGLRAAGGGGAGGYIYQQGEVRQSGTYNISVGAGAPVPATQTIASQGGNSQFDNLTAIGGGGGAGTCQIVNPIPNDFPSSSGGSGGGGSDSTCWQGSAGTPGQGNNGGNNTLEGFSPNGTAGSGGGGAGGVGQNITANNVENGGAGGAGVSNTITGVSYTYSAGGRGGNKSSNNNGTAGINYGDAGAGADGGIGADNVGGAGADGVVIIRVPTTQAVNLVGLTFTQQTVVSDTVYTITSGTGTLEFVGAGAPSWQQISSPTLQDAFDNGSQITTDTNSLSLQSTAVNPGFPLLSIIDNALNITTEIRANGDIFSTGSYINPSLTGVINLTGNVNANNNNITNINEITTNIINPAVGFGNINFNGTLLLNGFGITGAGAVSLNSLSGTNPAGVIVNDNLVMTNRNITGLTSLQTTSLNGNGADILVGNAIDMQFRDILDCNLMRINQFSGLNAGADPIDIVSDINVGNNSLIDVLDLNANQITVNTLLGVGVNPIIVNSPVNMNGSNIDNINQATITNDLIVGGITQDTNPTAYVTRYGNVGVPIVTILDGQIDVDPGPIANNGEFLMTSIVGTNTGTRVDVAGYYKVKVSSVIDLPSKATTLTLRIQKRNSDLDPWVTVAQNVVLPDTVSLHEFSQNFFDANISNVGTGFRCTYSAAGGDYTITSLNFEIERKLRTS